MDRNREELFGKLLKAYLAGDLSDADAEQLRALLESDDYQQRFNSAVKLHASASIPVFEAAQRENYEALVDRMGLGRDATHMLKGRMRWKLVAAVFVGFFIAALYFYWGHLPLAGPQSNLFSTVTVPAGDRAKVTLPDGTVVWLNAASTLTYPTDFDGKVREVRLEGEGFFDVKRDERRPFLVRTDYLAVRVLGTAFNIKAYVPDTGIDVTLLEGKVNVAIPGEQEIALIPDEQLVYQKSDGQWTKRETVATRSAWWTSGKLYFDNVPLSDIMKTLERRFDVRIVINSRRMEAEYFSGSVDPDLNVQEVLRYLDVDGKYAWQTKGHILTVSDRQTP